MIKEDLLAWIEKVKEAGNKAYGIVLTDEMIKDALEEQIKEKVGLFLKNQILSLKVSGAVECYELISKRQKRNGLEK